MDMLCSGMKSYIGTVISTFLAFGSALLIAFITRMWDAKKEKIKQYRKDNRTMQYYMILIREIIDKTTQQIEIMSETISKQKTKHYDLLSCKRIVVLPLFERFKTFNNMSVFEVINVKSSKETNYIDEYNELNGHIDFIDAMLNVEFIRFNARFLDEHSKNVHLIESNIREIYRLIAEKYNLLATALRQDIANDKTGKLLKSLLDKYDGMVKTGTVFTIEDVLNDYISPISKCFLPYNQEVWAFKILSIATESISIISIMQANVQQNIASFIEINTTLKTYLPKLKNSLKNFSSIAY
jgi:hypothetical protein